MTKKKSRIYIIGISLSVVLITIILSVQFITSRMSLFESGLVKRYIVSLLTMSNEWQATVRGDVQLSGFIRPTIQINDIRLIKYIADADKTKPGSKIEIDINIEQIEAKLELWSILLGKLNLYSLVLKNGTLESNVSDSIFGYKTQGNVNAADNTDNSKIQHHKRISFRFSDRVSEDKKLKTNVLTSNTDIMKFLKTNKVLIKFVNWQVNINSDKKKTIKLNVKNFNTWLESSAVVFNQDSNTSAESQASKKDKIATIVYQRHWKGQFYIGDSETEVFTSGKTTMQKNSTTKIGFQMNFNSEGASIDFEGKIKDILTNPNLQAQMKLEVPKIQNTSKETFWILWQHLLPNMYTPTSKTVDTLNKYFEFGRTWKISSDITGPIDNLAVPKLSVDMEFLDNGSIEIVGRIDQLTSLSDIYLALLIKTDNTQVLLDSLGIQGKEYNEYWKDKPLSLTMTANSIKKGDFEFDIEKLSLGEIELQGRVSVKSITSDQPTVVANITGDEINIDDYIISFKQSNLYKVDNSNANSQNKYALKTIDSSSKTSSSLELSSEDSKLNNIVLLLSKKMNLDIAVKLAKVTFLQEMFSTTVANFSWIKGVLKQAQINLRGSSSSEKPSLIQIDLLQKKHTSSINPEWQAIIKAKNINTTAIFSLLNAPELLKGKINIKAKIRVLKSQSSNDISYQGDVDFTADKNSILVSLPNKYLNTAYNLLFSGLSKINCLNAHIKIAHNVYFFDRVLFSSFSNRWGLLGMFDNNKEYINIGFYQVSNTGKGSKPSPFAWFVGNIPNAGFSVFKGSGLKTLNNDFKKYNYRQRTSVTQVCNQ